MTARRSASSRPPTSSSTATPPLGFQEDAALDDGDIWATSFAIQDWTPAVEEQVTGLLHRALGKA
ncbi:exported protein of unknown function [Micropruina glycogenica]|uniref:Uncharacterized protein n=1 Tax=Micropruina glycogenica TaxID=75385 RepID=A0A2N9JI98_9ACTN|nr:exported protein of unknown function [Micropruina glycogenica]